MRRPMLVLLAVYVAGNALLYALLLPLWEGWDEPFHFGYVQELSVHARLPRLGASALSQEVARSLRLAPASHVVRHNLPYVITFDEFARMPEERRSALRRELESIPPALRREVEPGTNNYEAQHPPLAYLLPAVLEWATADWNLLSRVLLLRILCGLAAGALQFWALWELASALGLGAWARGHALFWTLGAQMFWACAARVSNDWLTLPLTTALVASLVRFYHAPSRRSAVWVGVWAGAGLLAKASFLAFVPLVLGVVWWKRRGWEAPVLMAALAGPWYARNVLLYGNLSAMQQTVSGVGLADVLRASLEMPWLRVMLGWLRGALWTGNNSFTAFSAATLDLVLALLAVALCAWWLRRRGGREIVAAAAVAVFATALLYVSAVCWADTADGRISAAPWYAEPVAPVVAALAALGCQRVRWGAWVAGGLTALAAYLSAATYLVKLIPLYGGYGGAPVRPAALVEWYATSGDWRPILAGTIAGPAGLVMGLAVVNAGVALVAAVALVRAPRT